MEFFRIHRTIPFMRHALVLNAISLITFLAAVFFILTRGFHLSIEFTGGTVMEVSYAQTVQLENVRGTVSKLGYTDFQVANFGTSRDVMIRLPVAQGQTSATQSESVMQALKAADASVELRRVEFVGPQVGEELLHNGLMALLVVVLGIMVYLGFRFEWKFAVAGVIANLHDVVIILGFFAFFQWEFSLAVLAAVLAVLHGCTMRRSLACGMTMCSSSRARRSRSAQRPSASRRSVCRKGGSAGSGASQNGRPSSGATSGPGGSFSASVIQATGTEN